MYVFLQRPEPKLVLWFFVSCSTPHLAWLWAEQGSSFPRGRFAGCVRKQRLQGATHVENIQICFNHRGAEMRSRGMPSSSKLVVNPQTLACFRHDTLLWYGHHGIACQSQPELGTQCAAVHVREALSHFASPVRRPTHGASGAHYMVMVGRGESRAMGLIASLSSMCHKSRPT